LAELLCRVDDGKLSVADAKIVFEELLETFSLNETTKGPEKIKKTLLAECMALTELQRRVDDGRLSAADAKIVFDAMLKDFNLLKPFFSLDDIVKKDYGNRRHSYFNP
jgi:polyhydroxyalkanoate synthesis regulator phasin